MVSKQAYGTTTRIRGAEVSYGQIEAAAHAILLTGIRPTVDGVREAIKAGSQRTLLNGLQRFWKELGERIAGVPDSRRRLPAAIADLADTLWQTALSLATDSADGLDAALKQQLAELRSDTEVRGHALAQREIEIDSLVRSRERTIRELEEHLRATMTLLNKRETTIKSLELRLAAALSETDSYRARIAMLVAQGGKRHRTTVVTPARPGGAARSTTKRRISRSTKSRHSGQSVPKCQRRLKPDPL